MRTKTNFKKPLYVSIGSPTIIRGWFPCLVQLLLVNFSCFFAFQFCGGMFSVCVCLLRACWCGVWMCTGVHIQTQQQQARRKHTHTENIPPQNWNAKKQEKLTSSNCTRHGNQPLMIVGEPIETCRGFLKLVLVRITNIFNVYSFK